MAAKIFGFVTLAVVALYVVDETRGQRCSFHQRCAGCFVKQTCTNFMWTHIIQNMECPRNAPYCDPSVVSCVSTIPVECIPTTTTASPTTTTAAPTTTTAAPSTTSSSTSTTDSTGGQGSGNGPILEFYIAEQDYFAPED